MRKRIIPYFLSFGLFLVGCQTKSDSTKVNKIYSDTCSHVESAETVNTSLASTLTSGTTDIRLICEPIIANIDSSLPNLTKIEKQSNVYDVPNTPVSIWYSNDKLPVKIECGVTDDGGEFTGVFKFYFIKGQLWYSDQIFARYLFESDKLKYWMDEDWNKNKIPTNDFLNRERQIKKNVEIMLTKK